MVFSSVYLAGAEGLAGAASVSRLAGLTLCRIYETDMRWLVLPVLRPRETDVGQSVDPALIAPAEFEAPHAPVV